jgi:uncharacterized membrane protein YdjX (TVP38/TMEM64 family)
LRETAPGLSVQRRLIALLCLLAFVLVPFAMFGEQLEALLVALLELVREQPAAAYTTIVAVLALDVLLPIPASVVSASAGAVLGFWGGVAAIWCGMSLGCLLGYVVGRTAGVPLRRIVGADDLSRARMLLDGRGGIVLILARAVPVLAEATVLVAGAARMRVALFALLAGSANLAVALAYAAVGALALSYGSFLLFFFGLATLPALGWVLLLRLRR